MLILLHRQCGCKRNDGFSFLNLNQHSEWVFSLFLSPTPHAEWQTITATQRTVVTDFRVCSWPATCFLHSVKCGKIKTTASQLDKLLHEEKEGYHSINMCDSSESVPVRTGLMESFDTRCNDNHLKLNTSETKELVVENSDDCNWLCVCSLTRMRQAWGRSDLDLWPFLGAFLKKYLLCSRDRRWHKTGAREGCYMTVQHLEWNQASLQRPRSQDTSDLWPQKPKPSLIPTLKKRTRMRLPENIMPPDNNCQRCGGETYLKKKKKVH